tara:strand:+ start:95 stop:466 length:372 start_codon:yes stop_codon:yes gene_type:complete
MPTEENQATEDGHRLEKKTLLRAKSETMPERVQDNIIKTAILEEKMIAMSRSMDNHVKENRQDNKEVHKRISDLRDEIKDDLKSFHEEANKLMTWRWMLTGVLIALTFGMTLLQTYSSYISSQ